MTPKVFLLLAALPLLAACSHIGQARGLDDNEITLRSESEIKDSTIPWTDELESDRLTMKIDSTEGIEKRVVLSPLAVIAGSAESSVQPLYPQLAGLGSLDLSSFPPPALAVLENFCTAFTSGATTTSFMTADSKYLLALFYHDVEQLLAPLKSTGAQTEKAAPEEAAEEAADFTSWRCGRPFVSADFLQVPVQFTGAYGSLLTFVYINREKDAWKIDQLQIRKWEAENDTK